MRTRRRLEAGKKPVLAHALVASCTGSGFPRLSPGGAPTQQLRLAGYFKILNEELLSPLGIKK